MKPFKKFRSVQSPRILIVDFSDDEYAAQCIPLSPESVKESAATVSARGDAIDAESFCSSEDKTPNHSFDENQAIEIKPFKRIYFRDAQTLSEGDACRNCGIEPMDCRHHGSYKLKRVIEFHKKRISSDSITTTSSEELLKEGLAGLDQLDVGGNSVAVNDMSSRCNGREKCAALTVKGKRCSMKAVNSSLFCLRHEHCRRLTLEGSTYAGRGRNKKSDKIFTGEKEQVRCAARLVAGELCPYLSIDETIYCTYHTRGGEASFCDVFTNIDSATSIEPVNGSLDSDCDSESDKSDEREECTVKRPYKFSEFTKMWHECEDFFGEVTDDIESTRRVRGANSRMLPEDTDGQLKAQYGRLLPRAMKKLMTKILDLSQEDIFLDIGHGIGNACIQAAFTFGCESRGIEVVYDRNAVAEVFRDSLESRNKQLPVSRLVGQIILTHGRLEDEKHQQFLTKGVTRAYVNNFNGVFAERSSKGNQKWFLDDYVAGLFALMASGTTMVTLHPLNLGPTKSEANRSRKKQGMTESENSSFYEVETIKLGKACDTVKWNQHSGNQKDIFVYKYTRVFQSSADAVFLCCNPECQIAQHEVPIPATTRNEEGRVVINHCECRITAKNLRRQLRKVYV
eukprot:scaffold7504_cov97-Cylindrotheca_fusiformis.AAC.5